MSENNDAATIISLERAALARWAQGDPSGFLEISEPDLTYFDPFQTARLDSHAELTRLYESLRGQVKIERWDLHRPRVQLLGDVAILTFEFVSNDAGFPKWRATEVYRRKPSGWRIVHTHWALPAPAPTA